MQAQTEMGIESDLSSMFPKVGCHLYLIRPLLTHDITLHCASLKSLLRVSLEFLRISFMQQRDLDSTAVTLLPKDISLESKAPLTSYISVCVCFPLYSSTPQRVRKCPYRTQKCLM